MSRRRKMSQVNHFVRRRKSAAAGRDQQIGLQYQTLEPRQLLATYYVDGLAGLDTNNGTTLGTALKTIQAGANKGIAGDSVLIRGGTYRETVTLPRSGTSAAPITFKNYNNENVILSGADLVTGWTNAGLAGKPDVWKATVGAGVSADSSQNSVFVDGVLKFDARQFASTDPLKITNWGQFTSSGLTYTTLTSNDLKGFGDGFWNGAIIRHHTHDWVITNSVIANYVSSTGTVTFATPLTSTSIKQTDGFYIYNSIKALDQAGEWYKDGTTLYYQAASGQNPSTLAIELKSRGYAFNVSSRDYINISGMTFRGASIQTNSSTDYNVYSGNNFYAYDNGDSSTDGRFNVQGIGNIVRDNEISQTWNMAVAISGTRNQLVNNFIHDIGYLGTSRVLSTSGSEHLISYNTVRKYARSFIDGFADRNVISYNVFEDGANLSWDTGVLDGDSGRGNGGGTVIHHNVFRNSNARGIFAAFYAGTDLVRHHNLIYDLGPQTVHGGYLNFFKTYHNTFIGTAPNGNTNAADSAVQSSYNNNLQISIDAVASLGVDMRGNYNYTSADFQNFAGKDFRLKSTSGAIDAGIVLPGINDGTGGSSAFAGAAPDAGALEFGETMFAVGHNFTTLPTPVYDWVALPGTNIFDNGQFTNGTIGWTLTGTPIRFDANTWNSSTIALASHGAYAIQIQPTEGMSRVFSGLKPNTTYAVAAEAKLADQRIEIEQYNAISAATTVTSAVYRNENYIVGLSAGKWLQYNNVDFGTNNKYNQLELVYSRDNNLPKPSALAQIEARLGSSTGTLLGTFDFNPNAAESWYSSILNLPAVSGVQSVVLVAKQAGAVELRLANVRLLNSNPLPEDMLLVGARNFGGSTTTTRVGVAVWRNAYEEFTIKTGPAATSAEIFVQNGGRYDAYLDRFAFYEVAEGEVNAAAGAAAALSTTQAGSSASLATDGLLTGDGAVTTSVANSWLQVDLGQTQPIFGVKLTAPTNSPGRLSNFRVSVWNADPRDGGHELWGRTYLQTGSLGAGETLALKSFELADDGVTELGNIDGRYLRVQLNGLNNLGNGQLAVAELQAVIYEDTDLIHSDGEEKRGTNFWQAKFAQQINVGELTLFNVDSSLYRELSNFKVSVYDRDPSDGGVLKWQKDYFSSGNVTQGGSFAIRGEEIGADGVTRLGSVLARYIKVQLNGTNAAGTTHLSLDHVRLKNTVVARSWNNVARDGIATQSSNLYTIGGTADLVNNGNINTLGEFSSTQSTSGAWWQVNLQQTPKIEQIVIYNRTDASERLANFTVSVRNSSGTVLWSRVYTSVTAGGSLTINGSTTSSLAGSARLDSLTTGQIVRVQLNGTNILSLPEVQVWTSDSLLRNNLADNAINYDLGTPTSLVEAGWTRISPATHGDAWWDGAVSAQYITAATGNQINRDFIQGAGPATFHQKLKNGYWDVLLNMGDFSQAHDNMLVWAQGNLIGNNVTSAAGVYTAVNARVLVTDGELELQFDDNGGSDPTWAVTRLSLTYRGQAPQPVDDSYTTGEGLALQTVVGVNDLLLNDSDPDMEALTVNTIPVTAPLNGSLLLQSNGSFLYTPNNGFVGSDSFVYEVSDPVGNKASATAAIQVLAAPKVTSAVINEGGVLSRPDLWQKLVVTFSANVNISASSLSLLNLSPPNITPGGTPVSVPLGSFNYDNSTFTATWNFNAAQPLAAAYYTYVLNSGSISSIAGSVELDGDQNGVAGGNYSQSHYVAIPGDVNLDGRVTASMPVGFGNQGDLFLVRPSVGLINSGATWAMGDFNGDGDVDGSQPVGFGNVGDLFVLLQNLGRNVRPGQQASLTAGLSTLVPAPTSFDNVTDDDQQLFPSSETVISIDALPVTVDIDPFVVVSHPVTATNSVTTQPDDVKLDVLDGGETFQSIGVMAVSPEPIVVQNAYPVVAPNDTPIDNSIVAPILSPTVSPIDGRTLLPTVAATSEPVKNQRLNLPVSESLYRQPDRRSLPGNLLKPVERLLLADNFFQSQSNTAASPIASRAEVALRVRQKLDSVQAVQLLDETFATQVLDFKANLNWL